MLPSEVRLHSLRFSKKANSPSLRSKQCGFKRLNSRRHVFTWSQAMDKELIDRAEVIRQRILQLRDSL